MNLYYLFNELLDRIFGHRHEMSTTTKWLLIGFVLVFFGLWFFQALSSNSMQKQINGALLSNQAIDIKNLVTQDKAGATFICIVPNKSLIQDNKQMRDHLSTHQIKKLNRKLNPIWRIMADDWHVVAIYGQSYRYYRINQTNPEYLGTQCLRASDHPKIMLMPTSAGSRIFYVEALGRSGAEHLPNAYYK